MSALSLQQAKTHLNITVSTHDAELQAFIDTAEATLTRLVGPLASTETTVRVAGCVPYLVLPVSPAISLTSVTPYQGAALTLSNLYLDPATAIVTQDSGFGFTARFYTVVYAAGRTTAPADLLLAVKELVRHLWSTQRGPSQRPGSTASDSASNTLPGAAHTLPFRVTELIGPHLQTALV